MRVKRLSSSRQDGDGPQVSQQWLPFNIEFEVLSPLIAPDGGVQLQLPLADDTAAWFGAAMFKRVTRLNPGGYFEVGPPAFLSAGFAAAFYHQKPDAVAAFSREVAVRRQFATVSFDQASMTKSGAWRVTAPTQQLPVPAVAPVATSAAPRTAMSCCLTADHGARLNVRLNRLTQPRDDVLPTDNFSSARPNKRLAAGWSDRVAPRSLDPPRSFPTTSP